MTPHSLSPDLLFCDFLFTYFKTWKMPSIPLQWKLGVCLLCICSVTANWGHTHTHTHTHTSIQYINPHTTDSQAGGQKQNQQCYSIMQRPAERLKADTRRSAHLVWTSHCALTLRDHLLWSSLVCCTLASERRSQHQMDGGCNRRQHGECQKIQTTNGRTWYTGTEL